MNSEPLIRGQSEPLITGQTDECGPLMMAIKGTVHDSDGDIASVADWNHRPGL